MEKLLKLKEELTDVLKNNILQYWIENTVDEKHGGFTGHINADNTIVADANKGIILNSRILWTFSIAYRKLNDPAYLKMADRAFQYIQKNFRDITYGGLYWEVNYSGNPINKRKQVYAQAFTIYALSEYYMVNRESEVLQWAIELFNLIEKFSHDKINGGYIEAFSENWSTLKDVRLSDKDANEKKTMNTHLHILEAYSNLIRVWPDNRVIMAQKNLISLFLDKFINRDNHLNLFFNEDWVLKSSAISFGHDIEASWLLTEAAELTGDKNLITKCEQAAIKITDALISEGMDNDGSIFNEREYKDGPFDYDKHWWSQAEGLVGLINAFQISNDDKYIIPTIKLWEFIKDKIIDHENGEWFWKVSKSGEIFPEDEKVGFWKCPYHNTRSCIEVLERMNNLRIKI